MRGLLKFMALTLVVVIGAWSMTTTRHAPQDPSAACAVLASTLDSQGEVFVARAKAIRAQHILSRDYDRQMIEALKQQRAVLQATRLTEISGADDICGCSGTQLGELRYQAHNEMLTIRSYLNQFKTHLESNPPEVFIDMF